jgi:hypothetical protein
VLVLGGDYDRYPKRAVELDKNPKEISKKNIIKLIIKTNHKTLLCLFFLIISNSDDFLEQQ